MKQMDFTGYFRCISVNTSSREGVATGISIKGELGKYVNQAAVRNNGFIWWKNTIGTSTVVLKGRAGVTIGC